ncbi:hypothetical protein [Tardibacter chloracetimidivorans]|uniref:hypothetical protein n=1 Tax=Tardibacter chloracetimidivorans TaxID=1921510 RepID=UPI000A95AA57|nr:hypothetical protein [Tardibacter chloracetimidivorans]
MVDDAIKDQLGTFIYLAPDGSPRVHSRMFSERAIRQAGEDAEPEITVRQGRGLPAQRDAG